MGKQSRKYRNVIYDFIIFYLITTLNRLIFILFINIINGKDLIPKLIGIEINEGYP